MQSRFFSLLLLAILVPTAAAAQAPPASPGYRIGPKDLVEVRVFIPELNVERRVTEFGALSLPLIGDVPAAGLTDAEFAKRLKDLLEAKYVQRASVEIQVREFRSKPISVIGAVKSPGPLAFSGRWTLLEALTAAGGLSDNHGDYVYVLRHAENGLTDQVEIRVEDLMLRADARVNLRRFANDGQRRRLVPPGRGAQSRGAGLLERR
jgi:polysaccharide export outer membrane protein